MKRNGKKGFTIAELTVVIALISLIGVMVASFSVVMYKRSNSNRETLNLINEVSSVKQIVETAILSGDQSNLPTVANDTLTYIKDGEETTVSLVAVKSLQVQNDETAGLYYCTLTCVGDKTLTFVVFSRLGESAEGGGE